MPVTHSYPRLAPRRLAAHRRAPRRPGPRPIAARPGLVLAVIALTFLATVVAVLTAPVSLAATAALTVDKVISVDASAGTSSSTTTPAFSTAGPNELLVAFVSADGPSGTTRTATVSGAGLVWNMVRRANNQPGTAEVWVAQAANALSSASVTSTLSSSTNADQSLTVVAFIGARGAGAAAAASAASGAPTVNVTTTGPSSLVYGVGNDWDRSIARQLAAGQTIVHQRLNSSLGDTYWVQKVDTAVPAAGTITQVADLGPTTDRWNLAAVEILSASGTSDTSPPSAPGTLTATGSAGSATLAWGAATDNVAVSGYTVFRSTTTGFTPGAATQIATTTSLGYTDTPLAAGTYYYQVMARDAAGNTGPPSNESTATVTAVTDPRAMTGAWGTPVSLPNVMQHALLLPGSSKILYFESGSSAKVLDPATGVTTDVPAGSNLFCAGHAFLSDGKPFIIGGDTESPTAGGLVDTNVFDPATNTWKRVADMHYKRWYPTATNLPDGRLLALSGSNNSCLTCFVPTPEIYDPATNAWTVYPSANANIPYYPFVYVLPDGRLVQVGATENPTNTEVLDLNSMTWSTVDGSVIDAGSATMYRPGKILKAGTASDGNTPVRPASPNTYVIDMTQQNPSWLQVSSMVNPRAFLNLTTMPDGNVLATGGESTADGTIVANAVKAAEQWNPNTAQWTTLASMQTPRLYHSVAMVLPDGRILVGGSGNDGAVPTELNYEIFSPPYLFKGARPTIATAPTTIGYGQSFSVATPDAADISAAVLVAPAAVTHSFDENGRYVPLTFTVGSGGLQVQAPPGGATAPPGYYMLFLVNSKGVPSVASWIRVGGAATDTTPPSAPGTLTATGGLGTASLSWGAATDNVGVTGYTIYRATSPGVAPSTATAVGHSSTTSYTDSSLAAGTYYYQVVASDAAGNTGPPSNEASATVTAPTTSLAIDANVSIDANSATATTAAFSTHGTNETLLAFVAGDGPSSGGQTATVSGAGLTWSLVRRANSQAGTAEVWRATAPAPLTNVAVTSKLTKTTAPDQALTVIAVTGTTGVGASAAASAGSGAPTVSLTSTANGSLIFGVGNDWDHSRARTLGNGQSMDHQWVNTASGDTYWTQQTSQPTGSAGTLTTINDTAPTTDRWNLTAVEVKGN
jgi:hypothetical protein